MFGSPKASRQQHKGDFIIIFRSYVIADIQYVWPMGWRLWYPECVLTLGQVTCHGNHCLICVSHMILAIHISQGFPFWHIYDIFDIWHKDIVLSPYCSSFIHFYNIHFLTLTLAPRCSRCFANSFPSPRAPPVITDTFPAGSMAISKTGDKWKPLLTPPEKKWAPRNGNVVRVTALGPDSILRCHLTSIGNPIVEIRRSYDRLFSTMGFPIPVRWHLYIDSGPWLSILQWWPKQHPGDISISAHLTPLAKVMPLPQPFEQQFINPKRIYQSIMYW